MTAVAYGRGVVPRSAAESIRASVSAGQTFPIGVATEADPKRSASSIVGVTSSFPIPTDEIHMKIMMVGDTAVGKTSIVRRIVEDAFTYQENATVGLDFKIRRMLVDKTQVRCIKTFSSKVFFSPVRENFPKETLLFILYPGILSPGKENV